MDDVDGMVRAIWSHGTHVVDCNTCLEGKLSQAPDRSYLYFI